MIAFFLEKLGIKRRPFVEDVSKYFDTETWKEMVDNYGTDGAKDYAEKILRASNTGEEPFEDVSQSFDRKTWDQMVSDYGPNGAEGYARIVLEAMKTGKVSYGVIEIDTEP